MTNNERETNPVDQQAKAGGWVKWAAAGGLAAALVGGAGIAMSDDFGGRFMDGEGMRGHMMQANWGGRHHGGMRGPGMFRMLGELDLTDEQEDKLWEIVDGVRGDARPIMRDFRDAREDLAKLLAAPTVDKDAVEKMRAERVAAVDEASRKITDAVLQAAEVLTPEQRAKLVEHFDERGHRGRW